MEHWQPGDQILWRYGDHVVHPMTVVEDGPDRLVAWLAMGTPIIARRVGALPELIRHGIDGFFADDPPQMAFMADRVADLNRAAIRARALKQFSAARMTDDYEEIYAKVLGTRTQRTLDEELNGTRLTPVKHARERERELRPA